MRFQNMRSTNLRVARAERGTTRSLPGNVGKYSKIVDNVLPGTRTRQLYYRLARKDASVLAQLRTGMARLNGYFHRINAPESDQCACGQTKEAIDHSLVPCAKSEMLRCTDNHRSNMSFFLGGKSPSDNNKWSSNMEAVHATIRFAISTGRLDASQPQEDAS
jgi:hypothetical protein